MSYLSATTVLPSASKVHRSAFNAHCPISIPQTAFVFAIFYSDCLASSCSICTPQLKLVERYLSRAQCTYYRTNFINSLGCFVLGESMEVDRAEFLRRFKSFSVRSNKFVLQVYATQHPKANTFWHFSYDRPTKSFAKVITFRK